MQESVIMYNTFDSTIEQTMEKNIRGPISMIPWVDLARLPGGRRDTQGRWGKRTHVPKRPARAISTSSPSASLSSSSRSCTHLPKSHPQSLSCTLVILSPVGILIPCSIFPCSCRSNLKRERLKKKHLRNTPIPVTPVALSNMSSSRNPPMM